MAPKKKILILEDDEVNQELLNLYLSHDFDTKIVGSITDAIKSLEKTKYDLIISDIYLGNDSKSDGHDFLKQVRQNKKTSKIPIVAYTAYNSPSEETEFKFTTFISKPITKAEFLKTVKKLLPGS